MAAAAAAAASSLSQPLSPLLNVEYYDREFSDHGVSFQGIGDSVVVRLGLEDGSTANLMLPSGLITSYKPQMWHGGCEEVLHTVVLQEEEEDEEEEGEVVVQGGVSLGLKSASDNGDQWSPGGWFLHDVQGNARTSIQGRRNSVVVGRIGFEEFHVCSPGSHHEWYGRYAFVCTGPSNTLKPITLAPQDVWRGAQILHNPSS